MEKRLYSLFELQDGKWVRISQSAFTKSVAVRVFQNSLLAHVFSGTPERRLKVVKS